MWSQAVTPWTLSPQTSKYVVATSQEGAPAMRAFAFFGGCCNIWSIVSCVLDLSDSDFAERFLLTGSPSVWFGDRNRPVESFLTLLLPTVRRVSFLFLFFHLEEVVALRRWRVTKSFKAPGAEISLHFIRASAMHLLSLRFVTMCWLYVLFCSWTPREHTVVLTFNRAWNFCLSIYF